MNEPQKLYPVPSLIKALEELRDRRDKILLLIEKDTSILKSADSNSEEKAAAASNICRMESQIRRLENNVIGVIELTYLDVKGSLPSKTNEVGDIQDNTTVTLSNDPNSMETISPQDLYIVDAISTVFGIDIKNITVSPKF